MNKQTTISKNKKPVISLFHVLFGMVSFVGTVETLDLIRAATLVFPSF